MISRHRLPCVLPPGHDDEEHRDALGRTWSGRCGECGSEQEVHTILAQRESGPLYRELCGPCRTDPRAGACVRCQGWTLTPVLVRHVDPGSGPVFGLYACPPCAAALRDASQIWLALFDHTTNCPACHSEDADCPTARELRAAHRTTKRRAAAGAGRDS
ncbi:hypothetical protein [Streptomyces aidingensis]|uniref:Uncharacterized protein n=1 Tax=Streptomyces aidingensis TaxID=910347 RepID=A0A1I1UQN8_9ACTN|nr:hypothetical protein [Streptomyces aidingensis]SFD73024.1 hypothetical protein SAMN05421773_12616 [Streptomyces aidingensis]